MSLSPLFLRVLPWLLVLGAGAIAILHVRSAAWDEGYAKREAEVQTIAAAHRLLVTKTDAKVVAAAKAAGDDVRRELEQRPGKIRTVKEIVHENPDFAAVHRPDKLHAQRVRDLDEISAAARARR